MAVERARDRRALAADAGLGRISLPSLVAGAMVAYGTFAILVGIVAGIADAAGANTDISTSQWRQLGLAGGIAVAVVTFVAYTYGGYVAGRMARRSGFAHGLALFALALVLIIGAVLLVRLFTDADKIVDRLRTLGIPTSRDEWGDVGTAAGIATLAAG